MVNKFQIYRSKCRNQKNTDLISFIKIDCKLIRNMNECCVHELNILKKCI